MAWIEEGEQVAVTRHRKVIARLIPEKPSVPMSPDFKARFGKSGPTTGKLAQSAVTLLSQERDA